MAEAILMKGNEAIAEAAIRAGCRFFAGYPITPQNEIPEYMSRRMFEVGGVFLQAESEVSAINMLYGAGGAGARAMTSSSGPGLSLKQEGISYLVGSEVPCVVVNIMRAGPGLGGIQASQADYFQATRGGGHGDYRTVVLAPASLQELIDLTVEAFDIADRYRNPVLILGDAVLGQMMEPVVLPELLTAFPDKPWATTGAKGRKPNIINSLYLIPEQLEEHNLALQRKFNQMEATEVRYETLDCAVAEVVIVAYGTSARICRGAVDKAKALGVRAGLFRPVSLWPFPGRALLEECPRAKLFLVVEMSTGQMVEDVRLAVCGRQAVHFYGRTGGMMPTPAGVAEEILRLTGHKGGQR